ncbi:putative protein ASPARTIC PROTEASE IN GUARD CELL 2 [Iris pallida]|uniref:Peptidase A1 domain-containing protein n=1 Tax=Iris pallida TaxID=29817 RepID=A0AAX6E484_IRIPA|nr:putative protein ASPARTIC PROTEASE IN GUARD CELL 2 [Iris pallida]KAJ6825958.1 putative protein ASPARTIC PROTEASE IN GUARD CELL 2 [Iris pallida]
MAPSPLLLVMAMAMAMAVAVAHPQCDTASDASSTLRVFHAYGPCSPLRQQPFDPSTTSFEDFLLDLADADRSRLLYLSSLATARRSFVPLASGSKLLGTPTYLVRAGVGTPRQPMLLALDTSSDAAWIPASGCAGCPTSASAYAPQRSTTYRPVPCGSAQCRQVPNPSCPAGSPSCSFNFTYGSSTVRAALAQDSLSLASDVVAGYTFGSLVQATGGSVPPQGLLGLGRGPLSFLSQSRSLYASTFSYCLPGFRSLNFSGTLRLGPWGQPIRIKTTPLLANPHRPSLYYVALRRIRVGRRYASIPPGALAFDPQTGAGTIFDSGTMFTRLVAPAYEAVRDEFRRRVRRPVTSLGGFDTCYEGPIAAPAIAFEFDGMNVTLPAENALIRSSSGALTCLAMAAAPDNVNSVLNVIASMQQQNHRVLFDVPNARLGVAREPCTAA